MYLGWLGEREGLWRKYGSEVAGGGKEQISFFTLEVFVVHVQGAKKVEHLER